MAIVIDVGSEARAHVEACVSEATILPSERWCDEDGADMTLVTKGCAHAFIRVHRCPTCGYERTYGGAL